MIYDNNLIFSNNQAITATAASTSVIDLQGGLAINVGPNATVFGEDIGIGDGVAMLKVAAFVTTTFTAAGAGTLVVALQGAPDTGASEPGGTPGTYVTYAQTGVIALADLVAGMKIAALDWPPVQPNSSPLPRYLRLNYTVATGPMTAGNIFAGLL